MTELEKLREERDEACAELQYKMQDKIQELERVEVTYNSANECAKQLGATMRGITDAGFTEDQAFQIMMILLDKAM